VGVLLSGNMSFRDTQGFLRNAVRALGQPHAASARGTVMVRPREAMRANDI
jgi:hypothetical protein